MYPWWVMLHCTYFGGQTDPCSLFESLLGCSRDLNWIPCHLATWMWKCGCREIFVYVEIATSMNVCVCYVFQLYLVIISLKSTNGTLHESLIKINLLFINKKEKKKQKQGQTTLVQSATEQYIHHDNYSNRNKNWYTYECVFLDGFLVIN